MPVQSAARHPGRASLYAGKGDSHSAHIMLRNKKTEATAHTDGDTSCTPLPWHMAAVVDPVPSVRDTVGLQGIAFKLNQFHDSVS